MKLCSSRLFVFATLILLLVTVFGCSQKDDVFKPKTKASLTLRPANLPELEALYTYEFWAFSVDGTDTTFTSLGKFLWDSELYRFRNVDGTLRDSVFDLPEAYAEYDYFAITIENSTDPSPSIPSGAFMLLDEVVDPVSRPIELKFPADLFGVNGTFFVGTPTDDTLDLTNEKQGVWLCSQTLTSRYNHDTLGVLDYTLQPTVAIDDPDSLVPDTVGIVIPGSGYWDTTYTTVIFGLDTLPHRQITLEYETRVVPDSNFILFVDYDIDSGWYRDPILNEWIDTCNFLGLVNYNAYQATFENLPSVAEYGWQYNAWVFSEYFPSAATIQEGASFGYNMQNTITADVGWKVLSLGAFNRADSADLSNQYGDNREVPNFPGEDFINGAATALGLDQINLSTDSYLDPPGPGIDTSAGQWGAVVVGLQPIASAQLSIDADRNFPLFFMSQYLADSSSYQFHNYSQFLPTISVEVTFKE